MRYKPSLKCKGVYHIKMTRGEKTIYELDIHNIFTFGFFKQTVYDYTSSGTTYALGAYLQIGSGSREPSMNDYTVQSNLWQIAKKSGKLLSVSADKTTYTWQFVYVVPANSSYVGTIREIGLTAYRGSSASYYELATRALVVDSEGNPIEIPKTYLDELTITVEVSITRPLAITGFTWDWTMNPFNANNPSTQMIYLYGTRSGWLSPCGGGFGCCNYGALAPSRTTNKKIWTNKTASFSSEWDGSRANVGYINTLMFAECNKTDTSFSASLSQAFHVLFPNPDIFPVRTLENLELGVGDGTTTDFTPILPAWLENTEKVYKNGVELVRGVDYLADHLHNRNRNRSVELGSFATDIPTYANGSRGGVWGAHKFAGINFGVSITTPYIIEYDVDRAFVNKANYFCVGAWHMNVKYIPAETYLVFSYSTDGEEFVEFYRGTLSYYQTNEAYDYTIRTMDTIENIRFIKIELLSSNSSLVVSSYGAYNANYEMRSRLGYQGEYAIRFLTPPAEGDILTMDCDIDRPWKDENTIIQWNPILDFNNVGG